MRIRTLLATTAVAVAASVAVAAPASANKDGTCHLGDLCYWWGANWNGSTIDYAGLGGANPVADYSQDRFLSPGTGQGSRVANNAEAVANFDPDYWVGLYTGPNFTGAHMTLGPYHSGYPWYSGNLPATFKNNLESHNWGS